MIVPPPVILPLFGGEDPLSAGPDPANWHHEAITSSGAAGANWTEAAGASLAVAAFAVDAYLYDPRWWFDPRAGGGPARFRAARSARDHLATLHFDDLVSTRDVQSVWTRYLAGTVSGLLWLRHQPLAPSTRSAMVHALVGAGLHAIQDFYSHSNWIDDPDRREATWFEIEPDERARLDLWTGAYELPTAPHTAPHGDFAVSASLRHLLTGGGWRAGSGTRSGNPGIGGTVAASPPRLAGFALPPGSIRVLPGINLDSTWQATVGARVRNLEIDGSSAFDVARRLATRTTVQWLDELRRSMASAGAETMWEDAMASAPTPSERSAAWERADLQTFQFLSAGPYPSGSDGGSWYLRVSAGPQIEFLGPFRDPPVAIATAGPLLPGRIEIAAFDRSPSVELRRFDPVFAVGHGRHDLDQVSSESIDLSGAFS